MDNKIVLKAWIAGLAVLVVAFYLMSSSIQEKIEMVYRTEENTLAESIRTGTAHIPTFTRDIQTKLEKSNGFQALVSYTDQGFEPAEVTIKVGDTIRFTNNSGNQLWVSADGSTGSIYPYTNGEGGCGSSDFDSCTPFEPQDFWEFTFTEKGNWGYVNNADKTKGGSIHTF